MTGLRKRKIFFWLILILFILSTTFVLLYSQGYRFELKKGIFIHSGSITVKPTPKDVSIWINDQLQEKGSYDIINGAITINGFRPGNYTIKLKADGYRDWVKPAQVKSGISEEFWNALLVPNEIELTNYQLKGVIKFFPASSYEKIAWVGEISDGISLNLFEMGNNSNTQISEFPNFSFNPKSNENIEWNFTEDMIAVPLVKEKKQHYYIADVNDNKNNFFLESFLNESYFSVKSLRWYPRRKNSFYFMARSEEEAPFNLYLYDVKAKEYQLIAQEIAAYDIAPDSLFVLKNNGIIYQYNLDGSKENQITNSAIPLGDKTHLEDTRLIAYDIYRQIVITGEKKLFLHNFGQEGEILREITADAEGVHFSNDGKKLLYWTKNLMGVYFLRKWEVQPQRRENENQEILRQLSPIGSAFWYKDYEHVIFTSENSIKIIDLDPRGGRIIENITQTKSSDFFATYNHSDNLLLFNDMSGDKMALFGFYFPQKSNFFEL